VLRARTVSAGEQPLRANLDTPVFNHTFQPAVESLLLIKYLILILLSTTTVLYCFRCNMLFHYYGTVVFICVSFCFLYCIH